MWKELSLTVYCPLEDAPPFLYAEKGSKEFLDQWFQPSWDFDHLWQLQGTVPLYLAIITFPLMNFKSPTFFTKFNVLGTVSVVYLLVFTGSKLVECGFNMNFSDPDSIHYAAPFRWRFPALTGTMTLSYFIHNAVLTILRNQKTPENNVSEHARDLSIGYLLAASCYVFIGFTFYAGFPVQRSCISDRMLFRSSSWEVQFACLTKEFQNFLNNFGAGDILSSTARLFLLFQMITVLPLLMFLIRSQLFYAFTGKTWPGYVGSLSGLIYVFALPCVVYMRRLHLEGRLTSTKRFVHTTIIVLGLLNFFAQFLI
ncbi:unnamed protein product [Heligmosomoides polygyrus]|uniref:Aa_trans domain-containing protein n=1 Tax=Heligmosomoides polygyrus TaxID=6339 RepID=A0A3P8CZI2_HELPZ|nr:unnamed protein product [Heligmosomoides polygyrus]